RDHPARADDRLRDDRGDPVMPRLLDLAPDRLEVVGRDAQGLGDQRLAAVALTVGRKAADARAEPVQPVVALVTRGDDALLGASQVLPIAARELAGELDGVRAAARPEDARVGDGPERDDALGQL